MTHDALAAIVRRRFELFNAHDPEAASELYATGAVVESPTAGRLSGRASIASTISAAC